MLFVSSSRKPLTTPTPNLLAFCSLLPFTTPTSGGSEFISLYFCFLMELDDSFLFFLCW
jgi:hypothetical protein